MFLVEDCGQKLPLSSGAPDLKAIAQSSSLSDTIGLLKLAVVAAINCNDRIDYLTRMQEMDQMTMQVLIATAQETEDETTSDDRQQDVGVATPEPERPTSRHTSRPTSNAGPKVDQDLESEERIGRVLADNHRIAAEKKEVERQLDDAYARYEKLQDSLDRTQEELKEASDRLTAVLAGRAESGSKDIRNETIIATLEGRASAAEAEVKDLRKSNELLKIKVEKTQKLQDDYDEIKIERDRLSRKANAADKYKQKLEASADLEKENLSLRDKVGELQMQIRQSDTRSMSTSDLEREIDEYKRLLPSIEQERYELNEMKKRLEFDYHTLEARYHDASEQLQQRDQEVEELRGQLRDYGDGMVPSNHREEVSKDLEQEEAEFAESEARLTAALLNGDEGESGISEDELKAIMSAMRAQAQAGSVNERESSTRAQKKLLVVVERSRTKNKELAEHIRKQSELIHDLQNQTPRTVLTATPKEETPPPPPPKDPPMRPPSPSPSEAEIQLEATLRLNANLQRELNLVTSAWHEQNRRFASGGMVTLRTRASPEPRSFLGKHRKMIDVVALGGSARS
jgi:chromosome segregation ATPase